MLLDSEATNVLSAVKSFGHIGIELDEEQKQWVVGRHPDEYLVPFLDRHTIDVAVIKELQRKYYYELIESTPVFPETLNLVKKLQQHGIRLAFCTSASRAGTQKILTMLGLDGIFELLITKEDYHHKKPDPEPYLATVKQLALAPEECLVIEDSEVGLKSAVAAGVKCIVIYTDSTKHHNFHGATKVVSNAQALDAANLLAP